MEINGFDTLYCKLREQRFSGFPEELLPYCENSRAVRWAEGLRWYPLEEFNRIAELMKDNFAFLRYFLGGSFEISEPGDLARVLLRVCGKADSDPARGKTVAFENKGDYIEVRFI